MENKPSTARRQLWSCLTEAGGILPLKELRQNRAVQPNGRGRKKFSSNLDSFADRRRFPGCLGNLFRGLVKIGTALALDWE